MPFAVRASFAARIYYAVRASFVARACLVGWGLSLSGAVLRCPVLSCAARCCPALPGAALCCPVLPCAALCCPASPDGAVRPDCATLHRFLSVSRAAAYGRPGAVRRCGICPCNRQRPGRSGSRWRSASRSCAPGSQPGLRQSPVAERIPEQRPGMFAGGYGIDGWQRVAGSRQGVCPTVFRDPVPVGCEAFAHTGAVRRRVVPKKIATDRMPVCCNSDTPDGVGGACGVSVCRLTSSAA